MTLNSVMAVTLHYFTEFDKPVFQHITCRSVAEFMHESIVFVVRVTCRRKESSRSLSHLLMSYLLHTAVKIPMLKNNARGRGNPGMTGTRRHWMFGRKCFALNSDSSESLEKN